MKRIIKDYLSFTRRERIAVIILLVLMAGFISLPYLYRSASKLPPPDAALDEFLAAPEISIKGDSVHFTEKSPADKPRPAKLFVFDPNTITEEGWMQLGLSNRTARTIINYRSKGGRFRDAESIRKIWGMTKTDADRIIPFVRINDAEKNIVSKKESPIKKTVIDRKSPHSIDINTATVLDWQSLPGIGEVLGNRIIKNRERLGGFVSIEQVGGTYGLSDSVFTNLKPYLRFDAANMPKININTASLYELRSKFGLTYHAAKAIISYREQHGSYHSIEELRAATELPESAWEKLRMVGVVQ